MKTILSPLTIALVLASVMPTFAQLRDTELKVERRTLDRQDKVARPRQNAEELTRGLRITVKNTGSRALAEGEVEWSILVARAGSRDALLSTGKEKLKALAVSEMAIFDAGAVPVQSVNGNRQDMEYRVVVQRGGTEVAKLESIPSFEQQAQAARSMEKEGRKRKR